MKLRLLSTNLKSQSLKRIAEGLSTKLGYKVWRGSKLVPNRTHLRYGDQKSKLQQYEWFKNNGVVALEFTTSIEEAKEWTNETTVFCRVLGNSSEGKGIVVAENAMEIKPATVFTKYKKKKKEFRVHVFKDQVVHVLEKRRKVGFKGESNSKIRNTANGYVFCSENVEEPPGIRELAIKASKVTSSDFKGIDIGWNEKKQELFVIEVNSAPGIEGTNVDRYIKVICESL